VARISLAMPAPTRSFTSRHYLHMPADRAADAKAVIDSFNRGDLALKDGDTSYRD
jgi:hypothetical protein